MVIEYSKKNRIAQDKYYTGKNNATAAWACLREWIEKLELEDVTIVDPAAGDGALLDVLEGYPFRGYDLFPEREDLIKNDFIDNPSIYKKGDVVFMNPPFGSRGKLCKTFIEESIKQCDLVGCIVPNSFVKVKKNISGASYDVLYAQQLDSSDFLLLDEQFEVNAYFLIITNKQKKFKRYTEITIEEVTEPTDKPTNEDFINKLIPALIADYSRQLRAKMLGGVNEN